MSAAAHITNHHLLPANHQVAPNSIRERDRERERQRERETEREREFCPFPRKDIR
jgi:hypothetical protein